MHQSKVLTRRHADLSVVTATGSQVQSQASAQVRSGGHTVRRSAARKSTSASAFPVKKRGSGKKPEGSSRKKPKFVSEEDLDTSLASAISELPSVHRSGEVIDYNNVNLIFQKFFTDCQDAFIFDDPQKKTELDVMRLHNAPPHWMIRAFEPKGMEELKNYLMNMPDRSQKQTLCVMPKLDFKPKDLSEMMECDFHIINGQHSVAASQAMSQRPSGKTSGLGNASSYGRRTMTSCGRYLHSTIGSTTWRHSNQLGRQTSLRQEPSGRNTADPFQNIRQPG